MSSVCVNPLLSIHNPPIHSLFMHKNSSNFHTRSGHNNRQQCAFVISCSVPARTNRPDYIPNRIPDPNYVRVLDTTLRESEKSTLAKLTTNQRLQIARQLARLGVDVIEAGFPAYSESELEAVKLIAKEVGNSPGEEVEGEVPVICALARCDKVDIDKAWEAVKHAEKPRIHMFMATADTEKMNVQETIQEATSMVAYARSLGCYDIQFCPLDAARCEREVLYYILGEVIKVGATTINISDSHGYALPSEHGQLIADIKANTRGIQNVIISTHFHNDLGLATANTLAGASAGARQVQVSINGIGERAGNASLEEVVMAIKSRGGQALGALYTGINTQQIIMTSKMVEKYTGLVVQPHKPIVGANAFIKSGTHQDQEHAFIHPEDIGLDLNNQSEVVSGKLSGTTSLDKIVGGEVPGEVEVHKVFHTIGGEDEISYTNNSLLANIIIQKARHVLEQSIKDLCSFEELPKCITIADMGCASGPNAYLPVQEIIEIIRQVYQERNQQPPSVQVFFNDLVVNDFNTLFRSLPEFYKNYEEKNNTSRSCFVGAMPGSFYGRLFPENSLHFVHSSYSLHFLSQVPKGLVSETGEPVNKRSIYISKTLSPPGVHAAYMDQFNKDFTAFLRSRSPEMAFPGHLALTFMSKNDENDGLVGPAFLASVIDILMNKGVIEEEKVATFDIPLYTPSIEEVKAVIEAEGSFELRHLETFKLTWDAGSMATGKKHKGEQGATFARAVLGPVLASHFGEGIMDEFTSTFAQKATEYLEMGKGVMTMVVVYLAKK